MHLAPRHHRELHAPRAPQPSYKRLHQPTRLPTLADHSGLRRSLERLAWLIGGR